MFGAADMDVRRRLPVEGDALGALATTRPWKLKRWVTRITVPRRNPSSSMRNRCRSSMSIAVITMSTCSGQVSTVVSVTCAPSGALLGEVMVPIVMAALGKVNTLAAKK